MDYDLQHDAFGNVTNAADASGHVWSYVYGPNAVLLGETVTTGDRENVLTRHVDAFRRPTGYGLSVDGISRGGIGYAYDAEDRLVSVTAKTLTNDAVRVLNAYDVMKYVDESGTTVAMYVYDDFGKILSQIGSLAYAFSFHYSTKYFDQETDLNASQCRFYHCACRSWLNRDGVRMVANSFGNSKLSAEDKAKVRATYDRLLKKAERKSGEMANEQQLQWYRSHGYDIQVR